jgi:hypothetical protein
MIDPEPVTEFEKQFATVLDTLDQLKKLRAPPESEGAQGVARWLRDFADTLGRMPDLPDPDRLTRYAEDVDANVRRVENKAEMALAAKRQLPNPMLPTPEPLWAKIMGPAGLRMTNGDYWDLAIHGVLWPWYCLANPCDSTGGNVDIGTTIYLRFPVALSENIKTIGGPGVCGHVTYAEDVVAYTLSDGQTAATNGTVMSGDILWHTLKVKVGLPILGVFYDYPATHTRLFWWSDSAHDPDACYGYETGWEIDTTYHDKMLRGAAALAESGEVGGSDTHTHQIGDGAAIATGTMYSDITGAASSLPAYRTINLIKWVGFA